MRALWTAASGMKAQQLNIDTISNNLANVNTTGYKKQRAEFKDLLYQTVKKTNLIEGEGSPVNLQIGHGVMPGATTRLLENGNLDKTDNPTDLALSGTGYFAIQNASGEKFYTRDGSFKMSVNEGSQKLVTSEGYTVLNSDDSEIILEQGQKDLKIDEDGNISVAGADGKNVNIGKLKVVEFLNPAGLEAMGKNMLKANEASGEEISLGDEKRESKIYQGFLESSNVQIVDEMIKMIMAQRAYEVSSKTIQTADDMMQMANNLRRG